MKKPPHAGRKSKILKRVIRVNFVKEVYGYES